MKTNEPKIGYVVTTIQYATKSLMSIAEAMSSLGSTLYVVGDKKSPQDFVCAGSRYLSVLDQEASPYSLASRLPWNSYSRKMIGYLAAIADGCNWIRETDDDNFPLSSFFEAPKEDLSIRTVSPSEGDQWVNAYAYFTEEHIWPRGFPLHLLNSQKDLLSSAVTSETDIQSQEVVLYQGLANGEPDVDAIYRLAVNDNSQMQFLELSPLKIPKQTYCPFNSQATTWARSIFPLLYLPVTCTFRMTDIWRSFVAQRILRESDGEILFTAPTVYQERNPHDLMKDFSDEIPGYLENHNLVKLLDSTKILGGPTNFTEDLRTCYLALITAGYLDDYELETLDLWITDLARYEFGVLI